MDFSAGISTEMNPESSIGKLMQMFKTAGMLTSAVAGRSADGEGGETGNAFFQLLQENMAALLKSDQSGSPELLLKQGLTKALEKLTGEDQTAANDILGGLACLSVEGSRAGLVSEPAPWQESLSALASALGTSDNSNVKPTMNKSSIIGTIGDSTAVSSPDIDPVVGKTNITPHCSGPVNFDNSDIAPTSGKHQIVGMFSDPAEMSNLDMDRTTGEPKVTPYIISPASFDNSGIDATSGKPRIVNTISNPAAMRNPDIDPATGKPKVTPHISNPASFDNSGIDATSGKPHVVNTISDPAEMSNLDMDRTIGEPKVTPHISSPSSFDNSDIAPTSGKPQFVGAISKSRAMSNPDIDATTGKTNVTPHISSPSSFDNSDINPTLAKPQIVGTVSGRRAMGNPDIDPTTGEPNVTPQMSSSVSFDNSDIDPISGNHQIFGTATIPAEMTNLDIDRTTGKASVMPHISSPVSFYNSDTAPTLGKPQIDGTISIPTAIGNTDIDQTNDKMNVTPHISSPASFDNSNTAQTLSKPQIDGTISIPAAMRNPDVDPATGKTNVTSHVSSPSSFDNSDIDQTLGKPHIVGTISNPAVIGNPDIDRMIDKTTINSAELSRENKIRPIVTRETQLDEEEIVSQSVRNDSGRDAKKKISTHFDTVLAEKESSLSPGDPQRNIPGKMAASIPESAVAADKVKTELRSKTIPGVKKLDSDSLNTQVTSTIDSMKTGTSDRISATSIINRVAAEISENLAGEGGRVKITLAPPSLGTLEMDVAVQNNTVKVTIIADNKDVQQLLAGHLDSLKGSLQNQGLTIERCDVMMQDRQDQNTQNFKHQAFNHNPSAGSHGDDRATELKDARGKNVAGIEIPVTRVNEYPRYSGSISLFA